jgi:transposase
MNSTSGELTTHAVLLPAQYIPPKHYSEAFKRKVVAEIDAGRLTKESARRHYRIPGHSTIRNWCKRYSRYPGLGLRLTIQMEKEETQRQLQKRIQELERMLAYAELKVEALETLIDLAEKDGLQIRKNGGAKLSTK